MNIVFYIFRFLYRIRFWIIFGPLTIALMVIWMTRHLSRTYETEMTVYTGIVSGYGIESEQLQSDNWNIVMNSLQNIINIITSKETLKNVSLHLYARCMIHGNPKEDNTYISAEHYKELVNITPKEVLKLIDKTSEDKTVENLSRYERPDRNNFVYGLFNWYHPFFSYNSLKNIEVNRVEGSDILEISYSNNDPGVTYQTLDILNKIYVKEYKSLQFGATNNVIRYFETELARVGAELKGREDSLTRYNVANRIINYDEQTTAVTALDRDYELKLQDVLLDYNSSKSAIKHLEEGLSENMKQIKSNSEFISKLNQISDLNYSITQMKSFNTDSVYSEPRKGHTKLSQLQKQLSQKERDLKSFIYKMSNQKYTKEGYPTLNFVTQWVDELLRNKKSEAQLGVMDNFKHELDQEYLHYSPIGSTIKRQERGIHFTEDTYLSILGSLNSARLRLKSLEMNSATLKVINPPSFPLDSNGTRRIPLVLGAAFGSLIFILGFFLVLEFLSRALRDRLRTEWLTSGKVLGAYPEKLPWRHAKYNEECQDTAIRSLANQIYGYFGKEKGNIVNLLTLDSQNESKEIAEKLQKHWSKVGINAQIVSHENDFNVASRRYLFARKLDDIVSCNEADVVLAIHSPLEESPIPARLLKESVLNLLIVRADTVWTGNNQISYKELVKQSSKTPVLFCLSNAEKYAVETFTGMLPPKTKFQKLIYSFIS